MSSYKYSATRQYNIGRATIMRMAWTAWTIGSLTSSISTVQGFPSAAVSCAAGTDALLQPNSLVDLQTHATLGQFGTGDLSEFGLRLELNGQALDPMTPIDFTSGETHRLTLMAETNSSFTGFLIRMDSVDDARTVGAIQPAVELTGGVKVSSACQTVELVAGVSQMDATPKSQVDMNLTMESPSQGLELDVTVVIETSMARNVSH
jgi:hypothetical protein